MTRVDRVRGPRTATNADEAQAWRWLEGQDQEDIRRCRGDPPEFVVDGRCAVEVRRLNLADPCGKTTEEIYLKFHSGLDRELAQFNRQD